MMLVLLSDIVEKMLERDIAASYTHLEREKSDRVKGGQRNHESEVVCRDKFEFVLKNLHHSAGEDLDRDKSGYLSIASCPPRKDAERVCIMDAEFLILDKVL